MYKTAARCLAIAKPIPKPANAIRCSSILNRTPFKIRNMSAVEAPGQCPVSGHAAATLVCPFSGVSTKQASIATLPQNPLSTIPIQFRGDFTLNAEQKDLVKASIPALEAHGLDITRSFYTRLIDENPSLNNVFNVSNQVNFEQPKALASAVYAYAANIDDLTPLLPAVELLSNKHTSLYVRPEQYAVVGTYLLQAIQHVLGDAVTHELLGAWEAAYWQLAKILIVKEDQMYRERPVAADWMEFRIAKKEVESAEITSFYLEPISEALKPLPSFLPGQVSFLLACLEKDSNLGI